MLKKVTIAILSQLWAFSAHSQTYNFRHYTVEDGLPRSEVRAIAQDRNGNLWLGTAGGGAARFNGADFYTINTRNGIIDNDVNAIYEDKQGRIWFATGAGVSCLTKQGIKKYSSPEGTSGNTFMSILEDSHGNMWFRSFEKGLMCIPANNSKPFTLTKKSGLPDNVVFDMADDRRGNLWLATYKGLTRISVANPQEQSGLKIFNSKTALGCDQVSALLIDKRGRLWLGTWGSGLVLVKQEGAETIFEKYSTNKGLPTDIVLSLTEDANHNIWVGTLGSGPVMLYKDKFICYGSGSFQNYDYVNKLFAGKDGSIWLIASDETLHRLVYSNEKYTLISYSSQNGLGDNRVKSVYEDKEQNIWLGTLAGGAVRYNGDAISFLTTTNGLGNNQVLSVAAINANNVWAGTAGSGVEHFYGKENALRHSRLVADASSTNFINGLFEGFNNNILASTNDFGVAVFNSSGQKTQTINKRNGLPDNHVWNTFIDSHHRSWFFTTGGVVMKQQEKLSNILLLNREQKEAIVGGLEDKNGRIWLYGADTTLWCYENNHLTAISCPYRLSGAAALLKNGTILFGTESNGVISLTYNMEKSVYKEYIAADVLKGAAVNSLIEDNNETLWIGSTNGIYQLENVRNQFIIKQYGRADGLLSVVCNRNAVCKSADCIWFGTNGGVVKINPKVILKNTMKPKAFISGLKLMYDEQKSRLDSISSNSIELPFSKNNISVSFYATSLSRPEKVSYSCRLQGLDKGWQPAQQLNFINYANLAPGKYVFEVQAINNDGLFSETPAHIAFEILKPVWQRWWFVLTGILFVAICLYWFYYWRISSIKHTAGLQQRIIETEQKALRAQMNPHFIFNSLNSIQFFITDKDVASANKYLSKFSKLMRMTLDNSKRPHISLSEELNALTLYLELEALRFEEKFDYKIEVSSDVDIESVEIPAMLIQPYLENAIWHGFSHKKIKGNILINIYYETPQMLICEVEDNGVGRKYASDLKIKHPSSHKSFGMGITSDRLQALSHGKGSVEVIDLHNNTGEASGTRVKIRIPV